MNEAPHYGIGHMCAGCPRESTLHIGCPQLDPDFGEQQPDTKANSNTQAEVPPIETPVSTTPSPQS